MIREDITVDQFLDVLLGNRKYIPCLCATFFEEKQNRVMRRALCSYVYNKIDAASIELVNKLAREDNTCVISALQNLNIDEQEGLLDRMWEELDMIRVYTKRRGQKPVSPIGQWRFLRKQHANS